MNPDSISAETKPKRSTSIPLVIAFAVLGILGYAFGERIMASIFYMQELNEREKTAKEINAKSFEDAQKSASAPEGAGGEMARPSKGPVGANVGGGGPMVATPGGEGGGRPPMSEADIEGRFKQSDADGNGKLEGEEISERMKPRLADIDTDKDSAVSMDEYKAAIQRRANARPASEAPTDPPAETTESKPEGASTDAAPVSPK
jgi:hypothetical protein